MIQFLIAVTVLSLLVRYFVVQQRPDRVAVWQERVLKLAPIARNVRADVRALRLDWRVWRERRRWKL